MRDVLKYLSKVSYDCSFMSSSLVFTLGDDCTILFRFKDCAEDLENLELDDICEQIVDRVDVCYTTLVSEDSDEHWHSLRPFTFLARLIERTLNGRYKDSVQNLEIGFLLDDECLMCPYDYYGFRFNVSVNFWTNLDFFTSVIQSMVEADQKYRVPAFYTQYYKIPDDNIIKILTTNTKVRRLGYFRLLMKFMEEKKRVPISIMNHKFEEYVSAYEDDLKQYRNDRGAILVTKTGNSSKPYLEVASALGLIRKSTGIYEIGKVGKVYNDICEMSIEKEPNIFEISDVDKSFLLELLLKNDYLYTYNILEYSFCNVNNSYSKLKASFQDCLLSSIRTIIKGTTEVGKKTGLLVIEKRIKSWDKPSVYLEHILMPRLNWLFDLGIIDLKPSLSYSLTELGEKLYYHLSLWNDYSMDYVVNPSNYLGMFYLNTFSDCNRMQTRPYRYEGENVFNEYLSDCYRKYKTLAPNRVTFSMASNYVRYNLLWKNGRVLEEEQMKKMLENEYKDKYIFRFQNQYKDGYIQKR